MQLPSTSHTSANQNHSPLSGGARELAGPVPTSRSQLISHHAYRTSQSKGEEDDSDDEKMVICEEDGES